MARWLAPLAFALIILAGCGGGDGEELLDEDGLRDCLAEGGLAVESVGVAASPGLGNVSPDFRVVTAEGVAVDVVVQGTDEKARRSAADIRGALQGFGAVGSEVVAERNALVVFDAAPSDDARRAVEDCLA